MTGRVLTHGKATSYNAGCRCELCTAANTDRQRRYTQKKRTEALIASLSPEARRALLAEAARIWEEAPTDDQLSEMVELLTRPRAFLSARGFLPKSGAAKKEPRHGVPSTYSVRGCRCDECSTAYREWRLERKRIRGER